MDRLRQANTDEIYRYINEHPEVMNIAYSDVDGVKIVDGAVVVFREYTIAEENRFKFDTETNEVIFEDCV